MKSSSQRPSAIRPRPAADLHRPDRAVGVHRFKRLPSGWRAGNWRLAKPFVMVVLAVVGSGPAMAFCRFVVKEYEAEVASRSRSVETSAAHGDDVIHLPARPASTDSRLTASADGAAPRATLPADARSFGANGGVAPAFVPTRSGNAMPSAPVRMAPAARQASPADRSTNFVPPTPATAYSYPSLIVDSTDNPGGLTGIGTNDTLSITSGNFTVGNNHTGTFTQTGGAASISGTNALILASNAGSNGTYNLSGGTLTLGGALIVGYDGVGTFNQSGGTVTFSGANGLTIGRSDNSNSAYFLTNGTLTTPRLTVGTGTNASSFNQSNGTVNTGYVILSSLTSASNGTYNFNGGQLNAFDVASGVNSVSGTSTFNFNGGTLSPTQSDRPNGPNPYTFMTGLTTAQIRDGGAYFDTKGFNITIAQPLIHSTISGDNALDGGLNKLGAGTLTLTGANTFSGTTGVTAGTLAIGATGSIVGTSNVYVGFNGTGTMNQDGGLVQTKTDFALLLGFGTGSRGTYNLTAGSINAGQVLIGFNGVGTMNQSGGNVTTSGFYNTLSVGGAVGVSTYNLSGGTVNTGLTVVGATNNFIETFNQSAGTHTTGQLILSGYNSSTTGVYNLDGGTLNTGRVGSTYQGGSGTSVFQFNGGTLKPTASDNPGAASNPTMFFTGLTSAVVRNGGAIIDTAGFNVTVNQALLHSNAAGDNATDGGLTKNGAGTLTLLGTSTYTGATTINAGTLSVPTGGNLSATSDLNVLTGGSLSLGGTGNITAGSIGISVGTVNQTGGTFSTNNSFILGSGGTGTFNLSGGTLSAGVARFGYSPASTGNFVQSGGIFSVSGSTLYLGWVTGGNATYTLSAGNLITGQTVVSSDNNTSTFTQSGGTHTAGQILIGVNVAGSNGTYHLDGGTLNTAGVSTQGSPGVSTFNFNGGTLQASASSTAFFQGLTTAQVRNGGAIIDTNNFNPTMAQTITHSSVAGDNALDGGLTKNGGGTLILTGVSTYTGETHVNSGTLDVYNGGSVAGHNLFVGNALTANGGAAVSAVGEPSASAGAAASLVVDGTGKITLDGTGVLIADGTANGYSSVLVADKGALSTQAATVGRTGTAIFTQTLGMVNNAGAFALGTQAGGNGTYELNGGYLTTGSVTGGAGTSTLSFNGGVLRPTGNNPAFMQGLTTAQFRNFTALIDTNGFNVTVAQTLVHSTISGDAAADGGMGKTGAGILSLTGANTYTGPTSVVQGTLAANNASGSATGPGAIVVGNTATLAGNGAVAGNVNIGAGGFLAPGNAGPGRLTAGGTLTLSSGSIFLLELGGTTAGSGYDQLVLSGPVTAGGLYSLNGNLSVTKLSGFTLAVGQKFFIIDETGLNPVGGTGTFANTVANVYTDAAGNRFLVNYADINPADGNTLANDVSLTVLTVAAIPEPSTWMLLLLGASGVTLLQGRLRRRQVA